MGTVATATVVGGIGGATYSAVDNGLTQLSNRGAFSFGEWGNSIGQGAMYGAAIGGVLGAAGRAIGTLTHGSKVGGKTGTGTDFQPHRNWINYFLRFSVIRRIEMPKKTLYLSLLFRIRKIGDRHLKTKRENEGAFPHFSLRRGVL